MLKLIDVYDGMEVRKHAAQFLYELLLEREPNGNISHKVAPTFEQHRQFVVRKPYRFWYLIERLDPGPAGERLWVGTISATERNEIGVCLQKAYREKGIGPMALRMFMSAHHPLPSSATLRSGEWIANIAPGNEHSKHVFQKLGFTKLQETYSRKGSP